MITANHKIVFLFSGQGSHYRGMGEFLFKNYPSFTQSLEESDAIVYRHLGQSLIEEIYERKEEPFDDLLITHPAIVAVEIAMLALMEEIGIKHDYVSGNSLGEFTAAVAAGIWPKETALEAAVEKAKSIVQSRVEGGMLAIINNEGIDLQPVLDKNHIYLASENFPNHCTISGTKNSLNELEKALNALNNALNITYLRLPVAYPFHSPLIEVGKTGFMYYTYTAPSLNKPEKGFISGVYCKEIKEYLPEDYFWQVAAKPTNFIRFVNYMESLGPCFYLDLGPSGTMANFVKYNLHKESKSIVLPIMTPFKKEEMQIQSLRKVFKTIL